MPDILIGNVRGPQGETGPANTLLASVYQFCASDTGATIPQDGAWTSGVPQIEKGKYIWCRNTLTWDSGPETVLYSVGYVGYDGEFSGIELVDQLGNRVDALEARVTPISKGGTESTTLEGAKAKLGITTLIQALAKINDYTTGINLLRGTRDFRLGTISFDSRRFTDGFNLMSATTTKDVDGFYYATSTGGSSSIYTNVIAGLKKGDKVTFSFMVMVNDVSKITADSVNILDIEEVTTTATTKTTYKSLSALGLSKATMQNGVWYPVQAVYEVSGNDIFVDGLIRDFHGDGFGLNIKMPKAEHGEIGHSIWSASPFDIDYINDYTMGVNLIRGSRDCKTGTKLLGANTTTFLDGFHLDAGWSVEQTPENELDNFISTGTDSLGTNVIQGLKVGDYISYSFEVFVGSAMPSPYNVVVRFSVRNADGGANQIYTINTHDISKLSVGEWHQIKGTYKIPDKYGETGNALIFINKSVASPVMKVRAIDVQSGIINNPIWSASPFDVASSYEWNNGVPSLLGIRKPLPNGTNLDDYVLPGSYAATSNAIATSCTNIPGEVDRAFNLDVSYSMGTTGKYVRQKLTLIANGNEFVRDMSGSTFNAWKLSVNNKSLDDLWPQIKTKIEATYNITLK